MSVCVNIKTKSIPQPSEFLNKLAGEGEQLAVVSGEYPTVRFGFWGTSMRGIEVTLEKQGLEVRICTFSSKDDYRLFARTVSVLKEMTGGEAWLENNAKEKIANPLEAFGEEWIEYQRKSSFDVVRSIMKHDDSPVSLYGLFGKVFVGPKTLEKFGIDFTTEYDPQVMDQIDQYFSNVQCRFAQQEDTSTTLGLTNPKNENEKLDVSAIIIVDGKVNDFDYISDAALFAIIDKDDAEAVPTLVPFAQLWKILPEGVFERIDDRQFQRVGEFTLEMAKQMAEKAKRVDPGSFFYKPPFPGEGYDESQKTLILTWNPATSDLSPEEQARAVKNMLTTYLKWPVRDYENAMYGDRFYVVKVGAGQTGIIMSGLFESNPYQLDTDKSQYYMDLAPNVMLNPEDAPMISSSELQAAIPSVDWNDEQSGRMLSDEEASKLETLWEKFLAKNVTAIDGMDMNAKRVQLWKK